MSRTDPPHVTATPLWAAPFRPFFILGGIYGPLALTVFALAYAGLLTFAPAGAEIIAWHGHEMTFGFAAAVVGGFVMTALPTWAGAPETEGWRLKLLAAVWLAGRIPFWFGDAFPETACAALDLAFFPVMIAVLLPGLLRVERRHFLFLVPIFLWLFIANLGYHLASAAGDPDTAKHALYAGIYGYMILFGLVGGFLTPIFTESTLKLTDPTTRIAFVPAIEAVAIAAIVAYSLTGALLPGTAIAGWAALIAAAANLVRMARWRTFSIIADPLLATMHLAFFWYVAAIAFRGLADLGLGTGTAAAIHMFTVGALLLMKISLMTRIALRHTGRPVEPRPLMIAFFVVAAAAPILRLFSLDGSLAATAFAVAAWALPFLVYLALYGRYLVRPSLPRGPLPPF
ncbi:MAG: NnrS family protein [Hyphomicrobiales bacterium]|nr:NnrS family protein [Hyphomicrobiales bacterium]